VAVVVSKGTMGATIRDLAVRILMMGLPTKNAAALKGVETASRSVRMKMTCTEWTNAVALVDE
jgi:hypothetical protein